MLTLLLSSWDDILQFIVNLHNTGISWGAVITSIILWSKMKRNKRFAERDERVESKINSLLEERGITWNGQPKTLRNGGLLNYWRSFLLLHKVIKLAYQKRRKKKMQNINLITLIPALLGVLKLVLQPFGIDLSHITDGQVNDLTNGAAALIAIWGVFKSHSKVTTTVQSVQSDPNKFVQG